MSDQLTLSTEDILLTLLAEIPYTNMACGAQTTSW